MAFVLAAFFGNLFQQLYTADSLIVGNFREQCSAAVSSSGSLIFPLAGFYSSADRAGVVIARYYGAEINELQKRSIRQSCSGFCAALC